MLDGSYLLLVCLLGTVAGLEHSNTLIGYNEAPRLNVARCANLEPRCTEWQKTGQCLANPYYMRTNCAQSCNIPSCAGHSKQKPPWKDFATEYHTKQYATRWRGLLVLPLISDEFVVAVFKAPGPTPAALIASCY